MRDVDRLVPHNARVWNYWLGGKDNYEADRTVGEHIKSMYPSIVEVARADRYFLGRAVRFLVQEAGIRQFLDIGTGLPTVDNTHEVAQRAVPSCRIVYVDNDPLVLTHARALLSGTPEGATDYIDADVHDPAAIVAEAARTLDFSRPIAVMMLGILNFVLDDEAYAILTRLMDAVPSGSHLAITHPTLEYGGEVNREAMDFWNANAKPPIRARTRQQVERFFTGLDLLDPGLVSCAQWRPDLPDPESLKPVAQFGAVAAKP
jgi:O-methyltransferase involved in polyketide biosynthesis